ncbi:hypothetical protein K402DRAFT_406325 [Aulographum hederae CBS 113979]|uniref:Uncharacterized protein n=1 Tax=Aulographum hederae CBS 113979 TaxID=1176131 RepID=A0A6G1GTH0_9PEZI|nr:hypothetical protein K402DRAFT_406325 [Aulographum hederae CBS 113979]
MRASAPEIEAYEDAEANEDTRKDVNLMIVDLYVYNAIKSLLAERTGDAGANQARPGADLPLEMIDSMWTVLRKGHPGESEDPMFLFRLRLLKFLTLYCRRFSSSSVYPDTKTLEAMRDANSRRAKAFDPTKCIEDPTNYPDDYPESVEFIELLEEEYNNTDTLSPEEISVNRKLFLEQLKIREEDAPDYPSPKVLSLMDLLPMFMSVLSSRCTIRNQRLLLGHVRFCQEGPFGCEDEEWMRERTGSKRLQGLCGEDMDLCTGMMFQAVMEQFLVYGAEGYEVIEEAFAWGSQERDEEDDEDEEEDVKHMEEWEEDAADVYEKLSKELGWDVSRFATMERLAPPNDISYVEHLENLREKYPISAFEHHLMARLTCFINHAPAPVLVQLEGGRMDGLTEEETDAFKMRVGLPVED